MIELLAKLFIKNHNDVTNPKVRTAYGTMCAIFGIITNLIICAGKVIVGSLTGAISITADGINNLTDSGSSIITLIGFKLSSKPADEKHPYGHERIEYLNSLIIALVVLVIGVTLAYSSIEKIITPVAIDDSFFVVAIIVLGASILVKLWQMLVYSKTAKKIDSIALKATAADSLSDVLSTTVVLVSTIVAHISGWNVDGIIGLAVAGFIIFNAIKLIKEATSPIIGEAPDESFINMVASKITSYPGVLGIHDFVIHSYGQTKTFITVHVEVDSSEDIMKSHDMIDIIEHDFKNELGIDLTIHMDPIDIHDEETVNLKEIIREELALISPELNSHDFRMVKGETHSNVIFDVVVPFKFFMTNEEIKKRIQDKLKEINPKYFVVINFDVKYV